MKWRFFYHFNKQHKKMSIHYRNQCYIVNDVVCEVPCETKWNKRQPRLAMQGFARNLTIKNNIGILI